MRDLKRDLEICEAATPGPWNRFTISSSAVIEVMNDKLSESTELTNDDWLFLSEARKGWPEAIKRALAAEAELKRLKETEQTRLHEMIKHKTADMEGLRAELTQANTALREAQEEIALLRRVNKKYRGALEELGAILSNLETMKGWNLQCKLDAFNIIRSVLGGE